MVSIVPDSTFCFIIINDLTDPIRLDKSAQNVLICDAILTCHAVFFDVCMSFCMNHFSRHFPAKLNLDVITQ